MFDAKVKLKNYHEEPILTAVTEKRNGAYYKMSLPFDNSSISGFTDVFGNIVAFSSSSLVLQVKKLILMEIRIFEAYM